MKRNWVRKSAMVLFIVGLVVGMSASGQAKDNILKVGCIMPFTGGYGFYGEVLKPGIQIYADILNADGGVKIGKDTYKIEMVFVDDAADPKRGPIAGQELIQKGCVANVGAFSLVPPIAAVLTPAKLPFVGQMQPGLDLKEHTHFIGANCQLWAPVYAHFAALETWPEVRKVGFLTYDWQVVAAKQVTELMLKPGTPFSEKGVQIFMEAQPMGNMDFTIPLTKFKEQGVDLILSYVGPGDDALVAKLRGEMGIKAHHFNAGTCTDVKEFIKMAGYENAQGYSFNWPAPWALKKSEPDKQLVNMAVRITYRFAEKYGKPMTYLGGFDWGINHLRMLLDFYEQAGSLDPDKVMEKARGGTVRDFTGTWKMSGVKTWGAPVVKPSACLNGMLRGEEVVYANEYPMNEVP